VATEPVEYGEQLETTRQRCDLLFDEWRDMMGLGWWDVRYNYYMDTATFAREHGNVAVMVCHTSWKYIKAEIDICTPSLIDFDDIRLEHTIVHELCHILVNEMQESDPDLSHEERTVEQFTKAIIWVRNRTRNRTREQIKKTEETRQAGLWFSP
jgi:hypothetical protein